MNAAVAAVVVVVAAAVGVADVAAAVAASGSVKRAANERRRTFTSIVSSWRANVQQGRRIMLGLFPGTVDVWLRAEGMHTEEVSIAPSNGTKMRRI